MAAPRRPAASGKPKLQPMLEARLMIAAERMGLTGNAALGDAVTRWIEWSEKEAPRRAFKAARADYDAGRSHTSPDPVAYGLPPDVGIPKLRP